MQDNINLDVEELHVYSMPRVVQPSEGGWLPHSHRDERMTSIYIYHDQGFKKLRKRPSPQPERLLLTKSRLFL